MKVISVVLVLISLENRSSTEEKIPVDDDEDDFGKNSRTENLVMPIFLCLTDRRRGCNVT
jgi:hypothetical protein